MRIGDHPEVADQTVLSRVGVHQHVNGQNDRPRRGTFSKVVRYEVSTVEAEGQTQRQPERRQKIFFCSALERHSMEWSLAHPLHDVEDIIELSDSVYGSEVDGILTKDRGVFRHRLTVACTEQLFNKTREFIAVCRDNDKLIGYCWFDRGGYTTYSNEEISNAKFHHVDLSLPVRTRIRLVDQMIDQHILWANMCGVPIICSTSIRAEHDGFMKIHKKRGFVVNGSYAWIRTEEAMKCLTK